VLISLAGDPAAHRGMLERGFAAFDHAGYDAARASLVSAVTHNRLLHAAQGPEGFPVALSRDERLAATVNGNVVAVWDTQNGRVLATFEHEDDVGSATFSPDGQRLLTGSKDGIARLWDLTSKRVLQEFHGHGESVLAVAFSPNGERVL